MDFNPVALDIVWTLLATVLVFLMQAGFSLLEAGATRAKNSINIIMKNIMDMSLGSLVFWLVGFGFMFGTNSSGWIGTDNFLLSKIDPASETGYFDFAFFIFQTVFAATAATIISGAVAERTKFTAYLIYAVAVTGFIYPIFGSWVWGGGWLNDIGPGFVDFAGSTVVHSVGGWAALAGAIVVGPRVGKYIDGKRPVNARYTLWPSRFSRHATKRGDDAILKYVKLAKKYGLSSAIMANAFVNDRPFVTSNIIGATTIEQLKENIESINLELSEDILKEIEEIHSQDPNPCV